MKVRDLIASLQQAPQDAEVELDMPPSLGVNAKPCEGIGAHSPTRVILWANTNEEN